MTTIGARVRAAHDEHVNNCTPDDLTGHAQIIDKHPANLIATGAQRATPTYCDDEPAGWIYPYGGW